MFIDTTLLPGVEIALWSLLLFSVVTWVLVALKGFQVHSARRQNHRFSRHFWSSGTFPDAVKHRDASSSLGRITLAAVDGLDGIERARRVDPFFDRQEALERDLGRQIQRERAALEKGLPILASVASTAPYIGLFGTVWGIMNAMVQIGELGSATLDVVAGPIGHALISTGIGLGVAIPAVLAYNYFVRQAKTLNAEFEHFAHDVVSAVQQIGYALPDVQADAVPAAATRNPVSADAKPEHRSLNVSGREVHA